LIRHDDSFIVNDEKKRHAKTCRFLIQCYRKLAIANVHSYFKTETHFSSSWLGPHNRSPVCSANNDVLFV